MAQYHPAYRVTATEYAEIDCCITRSEFQQAMDAFHAAGLTRLDSNTAAFAQLF
jgi:uncharacterized Fe-S radical SAM superfamily protein PflX